MIKNSRVKYSAPLEKLIVDNKPYLDYCSHDKKNYTILGLFVHYL